MQKTLIFQELFKNIAERFVTIAYSDFYCNTHQDAYNGGAGESGDIAYFAGWGWDGTGCLLNGNGETDSAPDIITPGSCK